MPPLTPADIILVIHALFVAYVVLSVPLIVIGGWRRWRWVRNPWFRTFHVIMIVFVAFESIIGMACPLTVWESNLRDSEAGQTYNAKGFLATWLDTLLFYDFPSWVFTLIYIAFALLVLSLFYFVPVRRFKSAIHRQ